MHITVMRMRMIMRALQDWALSQLGIVAYYGDTFTGSHAACIVPFTL